MRANEEASPAADGTKHSLENQLQVVGIDVREQWRKSSLLSSDLLDEPIHVPTAHTSL